MIELLRQRRSIRLFSPQPVEAEKRDLLAEALLRAPTSRGRQPWEFVLVDAPGDLQLLAAAKKHGSGLLAGVPLAVVVAANPEMSDVWIEDCSIAAILLQMAAESLGLKSCWVQMRLRENAAGESSEEVVRRVVGLPDTMRVVCVVGLGYPAEEKTGHPVSDLPREKLHNGRFSG